jgi:hypothetical protein
MQIKIGNRLSIGGISNSNQSDTEMMVHELLETVQREARNGPRDEWKVFNEARSEESLKFGAIKEKPQIQS